METLEIIIAGIVAIAVAGELFLHTKKARARMLISKT